jgi:hypothetical protein
VIVKLRHSTRRRFAAATSLSIFVLALHACGSDTGLGPDADQDPDVEQVQVDDEGATVSAQSGAVSLTVPPGAVPAATTITVAPVAVEPADPGLIPGTMYDFGPDGLQFAEPVTLSLAYDPATLPDGATEDRLRIFKQGAPSPDGGLTWLPTENGAVDVATTTVTGEISSFSQYGVVFFPLLEIATTSPPWGVQDVEYWEVNGGGAEPLPHLRATGGDTIYTWTVVAGELPEGLILGQDGYFEGVPTTVETTDLTVQVMSGDGQTAQQLMSMTVNPRPTLQPSESCTDNPGYALATFADANLEAAIRSVMELPGQSDLSCRVLAARHSFETNNGEITSLVGFQNMTGMEWLDLSYNTISDVSALGGLTDLLTLELEFNAITDVSPLAGLTGLTLLHINDNTIVDVSALSQLTSMESLDIKNNSVADIASLAAMTSLKILLAQNNSIQDITALGELTTLTTLSLNDNSIQDITALGELTTLTSLWLNDNAIVSLSPLRTLTGLTGLRLAGNSISGGLDPDFDPLTPFRSSLAPLQLLTELEYLDLSDNALGSIEPLANFQPLLNNAGLGSGDNINLDNTGVYCTVVNTLAGRGALVYASPLRPAPNACLPQGH